MAIACHIIKSNNIQNLNVIIIDNTHDCLLKIHLFSSHEGQFMCFSRHKGQSTYFQEKLEITWTVSSLLYLATFEQMISILTLYGQMACLRHVRIE